MGELMSVCCQLHDVLVLFIIVNAVLTFVINQNLKDMVVGAHDGSGHASGGVYLSTLRARVTSISGIPLSQIPSLWIRSRTMYYIYICVYV